MRCIVAKRANIDIPRDAYKAGNGGIGSNKGLATNQDATGTSPTNRTVGNGRGLTAVEDIT